MAALRLSATNGSTLNTGTFSSGTSVDVTVATTDWTKAVVRVSMSGGASAPEVSAIRWYPTSSTNVRVECQASVGANIDVRVAILRYDTGIATYYIQPNGGDGVDNGNTFAIGGTIDTATSFIIPCGMYNSGTNFGADDFARWTFSGTTNVQANLSTDDVDAAALCIADIDDASVQVVTTTASSTTATSFTGTISTAVTTTDTWLFSSMQSNISSGVGFDDQAYTQSLTGTTTITYNRNGTASHTITVTTYVVEISDITVEHGSHAQASGTSNDTETITSVDTSLSYADGCGTMNGWMHGLTNSNDSDCNKFMQEVYISSSTAVTFERDFGGSVGDAAMVTKFQVVTFIEASASTVENTLVAQWESLKGVGSTVVAQWESLKGIESTLVAQYESLLGIAATVVAQWESLLGIESTLVAQWESSGPVEVSSTLVAQWESIKGIEGTLVAQWESVKALTSTLIAQWESLQGVPPATLVAQWESLLGLQATLVAQWESAGSVPLVPRDWEAPRHRGIVTVEDCAPHVRSWNPIVEYTWSGGLLTRITETGTDGTVVYTDLAWSSGVLVGVERWVE